jgi:hypothetical protein
MFTSTIKSKYPPAEPGALRLLAPQRGLIAIGQNQNQTVIAQSMISLLLPSFLRKQESSGFWIPGRVSLARNDDPTPGTVKLWESPCRAGGLPKCKLPDQHCTMITE